MKKKIARLLSTALLAASSLTAEAVDPIAETDTAFQKRMQWFTDAQFGLFIHYGVYSTLGGEWKGEPVQKYAEWIQRWGEITPEEYIPLAANFKPEKLDADLWVRSAKDAGMKYMVITSKHHEGFCLWDSAYTEYDIGEATDFDRDILGELKAACDKYGLKFGTYYSLTDWHHPSQRAQQAEPTPKMKDKASYVVYMKGQLKELIDRYDPAIMWFDGDWASWWTMDDGIDLYNYLRQLSPNLIINNRVAKRATFKKDFDTPENSTPGVALEHIWEACWTVNHSWGFKKSDTKWKSVEELVQKQIDINTKGGNLLLNVGPRADGSWPDASFDQLAAMGAWNRAHSEAVYGTEYVELPVQRWGKLAKTKGSTKEIGELFAYVFQWPDSGKLFIKRARADQLKATTYSGDSLPIRDIDGGIEIDLSSADPLEHATVLRIQYKGLESLPAAEVELGLNGNELLLQAGAAMRNGKKIDLKGEEFIRLSRRPTQAVNWSLNVPAPSKYQVKILYSGVMMKGKAHSTIKIGEEMLKTALAATESFDTYTLFDAGIVDLEEVGTVDFQLDIGKVRPIDFFNIKTIILVPISD